ncbi:hypothetical protein PM082_009120 [Marasmius tenuissimus]|nr:hypothetical protein PM082_009120 [Marasmius tenuissimus]
MKTGGMSRKAMEPLEASQSPVLCLLIPVFGDLDPSTILARITLPSLIRQQSPGVQFSPHTTHSKGNSVPVTPSAAAPVIFRAVAHYPYTSEDPTDLSFDKGATLDILNTEDVWWQAQALDGTIGSEYLLSALRFQNFLTDT